jgi:hypothetical protein
MSISMAESVWIAFSTGKPIPASATARCRRDALTSFH